MSVYVPLLFKLAVAVKGESVAKRVTRNVVFKTVDGAKYLLVAFYADRNR